MIKVLDASALLALLLEETGASAVEAELDDTVISTVNLCEVATRLGRGQSPDTVRATLDHLMLVAIPPDEALAIDAAVIHRLTSKAGLSLGDRFCIALARRLACPVLTADRPWLKIADTIGVEVRLIR